MTWSLEGLDDAITTWGAAPGVIDGLYSDFVSALVLKGPDAFEFVRQETDHDMYGFHRWRFILQSSANQVAPVEVRIQIDATVSYDFEVVLIHTVGSPPTEE